MTDPNIRPTLSASDEPTCSGEACPAWKVETVMIPNDMGVEWRKTHAHCTLGGAFSSAACVPMLRRLLRERTEETERLRLIIGEALGFGLTSRNYDAAICMKTTAKAIAALYAPAPPATGEEEGGEG